MDGGGARERPRKGDESVQRPMTTLHPLGGFTFTPYVTLHTYVLMAMTGLGYLALTWSTVVLLGGFVTSLHRKDFWCLTAISMMIAARIFNDLGDQLVPKIFKRLNILSRRTVFVGWEWIAFQTINGKPNPIDINIPICLRILVAISFAMIIYMPLLPLLAASYIVVFLYGYGGPVACIGLALWRIVQRDYGSNDGDVTKTNLAPALDLFYCLILCQGVLYIVWLFTYLMGAYLIATSCIDFKIPRKWGNIWLVDYLFDTRAKCWRDPASIKDSTISRYAVDLIDSESGDDYFYGARMLATFIRQGGDVRSLLLCTRPRIQKLIDTLGWRSGVHWELRVAAACIVAHLAHDIHLAQFPGAIRCIATLLQDEATLRYWWNRDQQRTRPYHREESRSTVHAFIRTADKMVPRGLKKLAQEQSDQYKDKVLDEEADSLCNELILQGLTILERLASDHCNCWEISSTPGLLPQILAPLCSKTLIQGVKTGAWAQVVNGTFKVLDSLIRCPGLAGESVRRQIAASQQAISNLESILEQSNEAGQELMMRAMEILTELALDSSTNLTMETKENLMKKQLEIFLDEDSDDAISKELKATAGRTLKFLTTNNEVNSSVVKDRYGRLAELLDAKNITTYRRIAAQILENICAHCDLDKECVKDSLLPQILTEIQSNKRVPPQSAEGRQKNTASVDEEKQNNAPGKNQNISPHKGNTEIKDIFSTTYQTMSPDQVDDEQTETQELTEAFLSLTLVIYDTLISIDDFEDAVQKNGLGNGEFVKKLKTIVEENCKETVVSLRIVKLCGQIAAEMVKGNQYTEHFKNQGFAESLSKVKKTMSNLESCILFAGTELRLKKVATPLLSEIEIELNCD